MDFIADQIRMPVQTREPEPEVCARCAGGGWVEVYSQAPPQFEMCPLCFNPDGHEPP